MGILMQNDSLVGGIDSSLVNKIGTAPLDTVAQDLSGAVNELKATGGGGNVDDVYVNGVSVLDSNKIAQIDLTGKVNKTGDTMTGNLVIDNATAGAVQITNPNTDLREADNNVSSAQFNQFRIVDDGSHMTMGYFGTTVYPEGLVQGTLQVSNFDTNGDPVSNGISLTVDKDGSKSYSVSDEAAFRRAIGVVNRAAANAGADLSLVTTGDKYTWNNKVDKSGDTMTGQLKTSFKESVAMGSYQATATTIPDLANELRFSSGCCGSFNLSTAYTLNGYTIPKGWYNFFYAPHRSGGNSGAAVGDNCSYGALILFGMTVNGAWRLRYANGIQTLNPFGTGDGKYKSIWNSGVGIGIATNPNDSTSIGIGVSNAATFRSSIGAQAALSSSAGALSVTYNSTNAVTNNDMWYAKYGNVVQLCGSVKNKKAITIPSHGDLGDLHMFTLPSGYHPKITVGGIADNGNLVSWRIAPDGKVYLTAVYRSTGTWAAGAVFNIRATYVV